MSLATGLLPIATDSEGRTVPNAYLYSYVVGTFTPKDTYSDQALTIPNANPLQADGSGKFFNVFLGAGGYRIIIKDEFGNQLWDQDDYYPALDTGDLATINASIALESQKLSQTIFTGTDTGVADAYVLSSATGIQDVPTAYSQGMIVGFVPTHTNTGASTIKVGSLAIKNMLMPDLTPLPANFLLTTTIYQFVYILGVFVFYNRSGLVVTSSLTDGCVTTPKIADSNVTTPKIADANVTKAKIEPGTAYTLLGYSSGNAVIEYTNPMRLIDSGSFTAAASKAFVLSTLDASQSVDNTYLLRIVGMQPASDDKEVYLTLSTDAGSTYVATNYYYSLAGTDSGGSAVGNTTNNGAAQAQATILGGNGATYALSNAADETATLDLYITNCNTGTSLRPLIFGAGAFWAANANTWVRQSISVSQTAAGDYDAIKLTLESGGNFAAVGKYYLFKLPNVI